MSNELVVKAQTIRDLLNKSKDQIAMALPKHLNPDRLLRIAMTTVQRNPKLLECDPRTLVGAILQCAQLGLEPDNILGHAYLVPFYNKKLNRTDVTLIPGYKGYLELARRSKEILFIKANVVYEKDAFNYREEPPIFEHTPCMLDNPGALKYAYAVIVFKNGHREYFPISKADVMAAKSRSKAKDSGPWITDEVPMWKKTAIRKVAPFLPQCPELQKLSGLEDLAEAGQSQKEIFFDDKEIIEAQGEEASGKAQAKAEELQEKLTKARKPQPILTPVITEGTSSPTVSDLLISEAQLKKFHAICIERKIPVETWKRYLKNNYDIESPKDIQADWYSDIIYWAEQWQDLREPGAEE